MSRTGKERLFWALLAGVCAYFYLTGLQGAFITASDENRAYHFQPFSPLLYVFCFPFTSLFRSTDAPYYVFGWAALANVFLVYLLGRRLGGVRLAAAAALLYLANDHVLIYAKLLYYSTFQNFWLLVSLLAADRWSGVKSPLRVVVVGTAWGLLFVTNASSFSVLAMSAAWLVWRLSEESSRGWRGVFGGFAGTALVAGITVLCLESLFWFLFRSRPHYHSFVGSLLSYGKWTAEFMASTPWEKFIEALKRWVELSFRDMISGGRFVAGAILLAAGIWSVFGRDRRLVGIAASALAGTISVLLSVAVCNLPLNSRNLLWLEVPAALGMAAGWGAVWNAALGRSREFRMILTAAAGCLLLIAFGRMEAIRASLFTVAPIENYLKVRSIPKNEIATLFPIDRYGDRMNGRTTVPVPLVRTYSPEANAEDIHYIIHWPSLYQAYRRGRIRYYVSSGYGHLANIGKNDPVLRSVRPDQVWPHPSGNPYMTESAPTKDRIAIYDLRKIFANPAAREAVDSMIRAAAVQSAQRSGVDKK